MTSSTAPNRMPSPAVAGGLGALAMSFVGGATAVSHVLADAPMFTAQAVRYAIACVLLLGFARVSRRRLHRPRGTEWLWLAGVAASGLVVFNIALVEGSRHAEPAVLAVAVACVPLALSVGGAAFERRRAATSSLVAAAVVTGGAVLVTGVGHADALGLLWALVVFGTEAGFTLLAIPVLSRHGAWGVSVHTTWIAAAMLAVLGLAHEGPGAIARLDLGDVAAVLFLALGVTAVAFVLWYTCVGRLGAGRAGLVTGFAPASAAVTGVALGGPVPALPVWMGIGVIAVGLVVGFGRPRSMLTRHSGQRRQSGRGSSQASTRRRRGIDARSACVARSACHQAARASSEPGASGA